MAEAMEAEIFGEEQKDDLPEEFQTMSAEDIQRRHVLYVASAILCAAASPQVPDRLTAWACRSRLLENEIRVLRDESNRLTHEKAGLAERVKENHEKIKLNNQLPYLVANIVEVLEVDPEEEEEEDGERMRGLLPALQRMHLMWARLLGWV